MTAPSLTLGGRPVPTLGQGTWYLGDNPNRRTEEIAALRRGIELGLTVIDTAEMYGGGASERLVGEAIAAHRDEVFLVDKVLPGHASAAGTVEACERSLRALGTDRIDLYLLHWPGPHPLDETVDAFHTLMDRGLIGAWGVSNFDADELAGCPQVPATDQVLYNPSRRGPEYDLLPALRQLRIPAMAYSPVEQGRLLRHPVVRAVARRHEVSAAQVLLAWCLRSGQVVAIPKASSVAHVEDNAGARELTLTDQDLADLDAAFPPPAEPVPLEIL